jgi:hypothetical protein
MHSANVGYIAKFSEQKDKNVGNKMVIYGGLITMR